MKIYIKKQDDKIGYYTLYMSKGKKGHFWNEAVLYKFNNKRWSNFVYIFKHMHKYGDIYKRSYKNIYRQIFA